MRTPHHAIPLLKSVTLHCFRLFLAGYIAHTTYNILKEVWEDVHSEFMDAQRQQRRRQRGRGGRFGTGGGGEEEEDVREEQDRPYFSPSDDFFSSEDLLRSSLGEDRQEHNIDDDDDNDDDDEDNDVNKLHDTDDESNDTFDSCAGLPRSPTRRGRKPQPRRSRPGYENSVGSTMSATRELAMRLHSAGIPYASEVAVNDRTMKKEEMKNKRRGGGRRRNIATVEDVLQSLTRAEGNMLSQTLLTPLDDGVVESLAMADSDDDGGEEGGIVSAAAAAWNAIGGLSDAKESLLDLAFPLLTSSSSSTSTQSNDGNLNNNENDDHYYGGLLSNPPGVLLYGPPGCGKGLLVRALASTINARFLIVSPSVLLRKYVGETNLNVRALFSVARKLSPTVIFVDELDGLFRERGGRIMTLDEI